MSDFPPHAANSGRVAVQQMIAVALIVDALGGWGTRLRSIRLAPDPAGSVAFAKVFSQTDAMALPSQCAHRILSPVLQHFESISRRGFPTPRSGAAAEQLGGIVAPNTIKGGLSSANAQAESSRAAPQRTSQARVSIRTDGLDPILKPVMSDTDLLCKVATIQRLLKIPEIIFSAGVSDVAQRLGLGPDLLAEAELHVDGRGTEMVFIRHVRERGRALTIRFNQSCRKELLSMAVIHEINEVYEALRALKRGVSCVAWDLLTQGMGESTARGYFHWKGVAAEVASHGFDHLRIHEQVHYAYELFSVGCGLWRQYTGALYHGEDAALRRACKDLSRLKKIVDIDDYCLLRRDLWARWRGISRTRPFEAFAAMTEFERERHLFWARAFVQTHQRILRRRAA